MRERKGEKIKIEQRERRKASFSLHFICILSPFSSPHKLSLSFISYFPALLYFLLFFVSFFFLFYLSPILPLFFISFLSSFLCFCLVSLFLFFSPFSLSFSLCEVSNSKKEKDEKRNRLVIRVNSFYETKRRRLCFSWCPSGPSVLSGSSGSSVLSVFL